MAVSTIDSTGIAAAGIARSNMYTGAILQVVNVQSSTYTSTTTIIPLDNTIPQNTEGAELFTVSITPTSSTSKLLISMSINLSTNTPAWISTALFQDSTANAISANTSYMTTAGGGVTLPLTYYMTSGTTSSTTFKLRYGINVAGTAFANGTSSALFGGTCISSMTVMEIAA